MRAISFWALMHLTHTTLRKTQYVLKIDKKHYKSFPNFDCNYVLDFKCNMNAATQWYLFCFLFCHQILLLYVTSSNIKVLNRHIFTIHTIILYWFICQTLCVSARLTKTVHDKQYCFQVIYLVLFLVDLEDITNIFAFDSLTL